MQDFEQVDRTFRKYKLFWIQRKLLWVML